MKDETKKVNEQFYKRLSEHAEMGFYLDWNWKENVTGSANANSLLELLQCINIIGQIKTKNDERGHYQATTPRKAML